MRGQKKTLTMRFRVLYNRGKNRSYSHWRILKLCTWKLVGHSFAIRRGYGEASIH